MPQPHMEEAWRNHRPGGMLDNHRQVRWLDEEIYAWIDHEQRLEDKLVEKGLARTRATGRMLTRDELYSIQEEIEL